MLWEPAASALQACRRANPDDESVAAALKASHEVSRAPFIHSARVRTHASRAGAGMGAEEQGIVALYGGPHRQTLACMHRDFLSDLYRRTIAG